MREALVELRRLVALSIPIAVTQLGNVMLGVVDVLMLGRVGREELDAAALGNLWLTATLVLGTGVVLGLDPLVALQMATINTADAYGIRHYGAGCCCSAGWSSRCWSARR